MIYFDNASTTAVDPQVRELIYNTMATDYANPSSLHGFGFQVEKKLDAARKTIAGLMGLPNGQVYFTSGGTEANNTAVIGAAMANRRTGMHLITSVIEHPSVAESFRYLQGQGFRVTYLPVNANGLVEAEALEAALTKDTALVSIMYVNNEVGSIQPVNSLCAMVKANNPATVFHSDCVQAFCKHSLPGAADILTVSSHKIHGPKGVGALCIKKGVKVKGLHMGGGQEQGFRPGTENTHGIFGFALAAQLAAENMQANYTKVKGVKQALLNSLKGLEGAHLNGDLSEEKASPYILNLSFDGVRGEVLLHALENLEIYVATGAACSAKAKNKAKIVDMLTEGRGDSALRFSFCPGNTIEEAEKVGAALLETVPVLRQFQPRVKGR